MNMDTTPETQQPPYPPLGYAVFVIALMMFITMLSSALNCSKAGQRWR